MGFVPTEESVADGMCTVEVFVWHFNNVSGECCEFPHVAQDQANSMLSLTFAESVHPLA